MHWSGSELGSREDIDFDREGHIARNSGKRAESWRMPGNDDIKGELRYKSI